MSIVLLNFPHFHVPFLFLKDKACKRYISMCLLHLSFFYTLFLINTSNNKNTKFIFYIKCDLLKCHFNVTY